MPSTDAAVYDIAVSWNEDFLAEFALIDDDTGLPIDLTGYSAAFQVRMKSGDTGTPLIAATVTILTPLTQGLIKVAIPHGDTSTANTLQHVSKTAAIWRGVYDLRLYDGANYKDWSRGIFQIEPGVTQ